MIKALTGYSIKQWLMCLWCYIDDWRKWFYKHSKEEQKIMKVKIALYSVLVILGIIDFYALTCILFIWR